MLLVACEDTTVACEERAFARARNKRNEEAGSEKREAHGRGVSLASAGARQRALSDAPAMNPVWFLAIGCCDLLICRLMLSEAKPVGDERAAVAPVSSGSGSILRGSAAERVASVMAWTGRKSGGD